MAKLLSQEKFAEIVDETFEEVERPPTEERMRKIIHRKFCKAAGRIVPLKSILVKITETKKGPKFEFGFMEKK